MMAARQGSSRAPKVTKGFKLLEDSLASNEEHREELREGLWEALPQEILDKILLRLPVATQCRLRCVCLGWKDLLSAASPRVQHSRPTCTIMYTREFIPWVPCEDGEDCDSDDEDGDEPYLNRKEEITFFCPEERKWFPILFQPKSCGGMTATLNWKLVATDGGLLCYQSTELEMPALLVCNPITGSHQELDLHRYKGHSLGLTNFIVNLKAKTFTVVLMDIYESMIAIFDSKTFEWKDFSNYLEYDTLPWLEFSDYVFVWKNVIFKRLHHSRRYLALDMQSGLSRGMEAVDLPCDTEKRYHLGSWKDQVVLVQLHAVQEDPVRIWMLRDNSADPPCLLGATWEKVPVEIPNAMKSLVCEVHYRVQDCLLHGHEYVCFTMGQKHQWAKYTFKTKTWQLMPRFEKAKRHGFMDETKWFNFEPHFDMTVFGRSDFGHMG